MLISSFKNSKNQWWIKRNSYFRLATTNGEDKSEAILIYLSFNLARGHLKAIINSLNIILGKKYNTIISDYGTKKFPHKRYYSTKIKNESY